jgi:hypothetical protein
LAQPSQITLEIITAKSMTTTAIPFTLQMQTTKSQTQASGTWGENDKTLQTINRRQWQGQEALWCHRKVIILFRKGSDAQWHNKISSGYLGFINSLSCRRLGLLWLVKIIFPHEIDVDGDKNWFFCSCWFGATTKSACLTSARLFVSRWFMAVQWSAWERESGKQPLFILQFVIAERAGLMLDYLTIQDHESN